MTNSMLALILGHFHPLDISFLQFRLMADDQLNQQVGCHFFVCLIINHTP